MQVALLSFMVRFDIITIFPRMFDAYFSESIMKRAQAKRFIKIGIHNLRDYTADTHKTVDHAPFGGGPGMVLMVEPIFKAVAALKNAKGKRPAPKGRGSPNRVGRQKVKTILFSVKGKKFDQKMARQFSKLDQLIMICGRYEGVDERVAERIADMEVSVGDYVLTGGELPAAVVADAVTRLIPGVIKEESVEERRFPKAGSGPARRGLIPLGSYPVYTRPDVFAPKRGIRWRVPRVLLSGDHKKIGEWRKNSLIV